VRLKAVQERNSEISVYVCRCGEKIQFTGTLIELSYAISDPERIDTVWMAIPEKQILPQ
jgi:hypothetical protein